MIAIDVPALIGLLIAIALCLYIIYHGYLILKGQPSKRAKKNAEKRTAEADKKRTGPDE